MQAIYDRAMLFELVSRGDALHATVSTSDPVSPVSSKTDHNYMLL